MTEALIAGGRDPDLLADTALTRMRPKIPELRKALVGHFEARHAVLGWASPRQQPVRWQTPLFP